MIFVYQIFAKKTIKMSQKDPPKFDNSQLFFFQILVPNMGEEEILHVLGDKNTIFRFEDGAVVQS